MERLNILVLHRLGNPGTAPAFLSRHVFALRQYFPEHHYIYHDVHLPLPQFVKETSFDGIVLDVTLLCVRWAPDRIRQKVLNDYDFVRSSPAVKIALPQDEYDSHGVLDDWMCDWNVDVVVSVISSHWEVLYPRFHQQGKILLGYTAYVDDDLLAIPIKSFEKRSIDIGYRSRKLPSYFGRIGEEKWRIGELVKEHGAGKHLKIDIALGETSMLQGSSWFDFINESRFTLGANSGSSLLDPYGKIQKSVRAFLRNHPDAGFDEVEDHCFPGEDGRYRFTAISPRVLEAALLESCQILVEGEYSRVIDPGIHYIPIRADASNFDEVVEVMSDRTRIAGMIRDCRSAILDCKQLRASEQARILIEQIRGKFSGMSSAERNAGAAATVRYAEEMEGTYRQFWRTAAMREKVRSIVSRNSMLLSMVRRFRDSGLFR